MGREKDILSICLFLISLYARLVVVSSLANSLAYANLSRLDLASSSFLEPITINNHMITMNE